MASPSHSETSTRSSTQSSENSPTGARIENKRGDLNSVSPSLSSKEDDDDDEKASSEGKASSEDRCTGRSQQRSRSTGPWAAIMQTGVSGLTELRGGMPGTKMPGTVFPKTPGSLADARQRRGVEDKSRFYMPPPPPPFAGTVVLPACPFTNHSSTWDLLLGMDRTPSSANVSWTQEGKEMIAEMLRQAMPDHYED
jgi:hypothetical protein